MLADIFNSISLKPIPLAISTNLVLIAITSFIVMILKIYNAILEPMNYEIVSTSALRITLT